VEWEGLAMIVRKKKNWVLNNEMRMIDGERIMEKEREKEKKVKSMTRVVAGTTSSYLVAHRTYQQSLGPTLMRKREKKKEDCQPMRASLDGN
jgi:hypothetical protein